MKEACPISFVQINEKAARINALLTVISLLIFFFTPFSLILIILAADFFIRGFLKPSYSFYGAASKAILAALKVKPAMVNAGPKIFAAKIGFIFCCIIFVCYILTLYKLGLFFGFVFAFFAALEAFFGFCLACKVYPLIQKLKAK